MNRKLHNTASALMVTGTLFALGLVAQLPGLPVGPAAPVAVATTTTSAVREAGMQLSVETRKPARHGNGRSRRIRQSMAMPFFSFASRG